MKYKVPLRAVFYLIGLWLIGLFNPEGMADLMEKWTRRIKSGKNFSTKD